MLSKILKNLLRRLWAPGVAVFLPVYGPASRSETDAEARAYINRVRLATTVTDEELRSVQILEVPAWSTWTRSQKSR